jgi:hypothetical protein
MKILKFSNFIFFCIFLFATILSFQAQNLTVNSSIISCTDNTYITFGQGLGNRITKNGVEKLEPLIFESRIAPIFTLQFNNKVPFGFVLSPKIILRMFNDSSWTVRSPSYMPFILVYHKIKFPFLKRYNMFKPILNIKPSFFMTYKFAHHSNGAGGTYFIPNTKDVNLINGNFTTDFTEIALSFLSKDTVNKKLDLISGRLGFEYHIPLTQENNMEYTYYKERINLELRFVVFKNITVVPVFSAMYGKNSFTPKYSLDTYISYRPFKSKSDLALFAKVYIGPDYYNLRYINTMRYVSFGLLLEAKGLSIFK